MCQPPRDAGSILTPWFRLPLPHPQIRVPCLAVSSLSLIKLVLERLLSSFCPELVVNRVCYCLNVCYCLIRSDSRWMFRACSRRKNGKEISRCSLHSVYYKHKKGGIHFRIFYIWHILYKEKYTCTHTYHFF